MAATNFVMFAVAVSDVLRGHIVPIALVAQRSDVGALEVWRRTAAASEGLSRAGDHLRQVEDWWSITCLVSTMVSVPDLQRLWFALRVSPLGRAWPGRGGRLARLPLASGHRGVPAPHRPGPQRGRSGGARAGFAVPERFHAVAAPPRDVGGGAAISLITLGRRKRRVAVPD